MEICSKYCNYKVQGGFPSFIALEGSRCLMAKPIQHRKNPMALKLKLPPQPQKLIKKFKN